MANLITPTTGVVYKFIFEPTYNYHEGVYRLVKLMTYDEYIEEGRDLLSDFFTPNGKDDKDLNTELPKIKESRIMKLVRPDDTDATAPVFAPLCYVKEVPDCNVKEYKSFGIVAFVGITDTTEPLDYVKANIIEQFESALGIAPEPQFVITRSNWLTDREYQEELHKREETKKAVINYFSENQRLQKQLSQQRTLIAEYEKLIIRLNRQVEELKTGG